MSQTPDAGLPDKGPDAGLPDKSSVDAEPDQLPRSPVTVLAILVQVGGAVVLEFTLFSTSYERLLVGVASLLILLLEWLIVRGWVAKSLDRATAAWTATTCAALTLALTLIVCFGIPSVTCTLGRYADSVKSSVPPNIARGDQLVTIKYVDNSGYFDWNDWAVYNGDVVEPTSGVTLGVITDDYLTGLNSATLQEDPTGYSGTDPMRAYRDCSSISNWGGAVPLTDLQKANHTICVRLAPDQLAAFLVTSFPTGGNQGNAYTIQFRATLWYPDDRYAAESRNATMWVTKASSFVTALLKEFG